MQENERLKQENENLCNKLIIYTNKNNDLWNKFMKAGRIEEARGVGQGDYGVE